MLVHVTWTMRTDTLSYAVLSAEFSRSARLPTLFCKLSEELTVHVVNLRLVLFTRNAVDLGICGDGAKCHAEKSGCCAVCASERNTWCVCLTKCPPPDQATTCPRLMATARRVRAPAVRPAELPRSDVTATSTTCPADIAAVTLPNRHRVFLLQPGLMEAWAIRPRHLRALRRHTNRASSSSSSS
jgi:hypothetical protein